MYSKLNDLWIPTVYSSEPVSTCRYGFVYYIICVCVYLCGFGRSASLCNMQCMLQTAPSVLIMGGHQPLMVSFDLETRQEIQQVIGCCRSTVALATVYRVILTRAVPVNYLHSQLLYRVVSFSDVSAVWFSFWFIF